jgi:hypothetical protein
MMAIGHVFKYSIAVVGADDLITEKKIGIVGKAATVAELLQTNDISYQVIQDNFIMWCSSDLGLGPENTIATKLAHRYGRDKFERIYGDAVFTGEFLAGSSTILPLTSYELTYLHEISHALLK